MTEILLRHGIARLRFLATSGVRHPADGANELPFVKVYDYEFDAFLKVADAAEGTLPPAGQTPEAT